MLATERTEFRAVMERLGRVFDRAVTEDLLNDYWTACKDIPLGVLRARAEGHLRTAKFFPKPRELRENPDGERRVVDTRSPDTGVDDWTATLNRMLLAVLMACHGVPDEDLPSLVAEKNRIAKQMREAGTQAAEWSDIAPGVKQRLVGMVMASRKRANWPAGRGMIELRAP